MQESQELPKNPAGRPSDYSAELADAICRKLAKGKSLEDICKKKGMPSSRAVYRWLEANEVFRQRYAQAREQQADFYAAEILRISDDATRDTVHGDSGPRPDSEWIARSKLRVDTRKWLMGKLSPKKYGDNQAIDLTSGGLKLQGIQINDIGPA